MNEKNNIVEEKLNDVNDSVDNESFESELDTLPSKKKDKKIKKHVEALRLVEEAKKIVKVADEQTEACKLLLVSDLKEYEDAKSSLRVGGLNACTSLLNKLGYKNNNGKQQTDENVVVFEPKEELEPIALRNVSSGQFTGMVYALMGGTVTTIGLIYLATEKLGMTLDITKVPTVETMQKVTSWFSSAVGLESNVYIGTGILAFASFSVIALIYGIRVSMKGNKNLHFAVKQLAEAELYTEAKGHCKAEMDKVDAHMKETVSTLKMYEVLFNEQKGKLERILHIEGSKEKSTDYHEKSFLEIRETKELMRSIRDFISTPMSEEGKLSEKSIKFLERAKSQMDKILERLY